MKYLKIPITLHEGIESPNRKIIPTLLKERSEKTQANGHEIQEYEPDLPQIGWEKVRDLPYVIRNKKLSRLKLLLLETCFIFFPFLLALDFGSHHEISKYRIDINELIFTFLIGVAVFSFLILLVISERKLVRITEKGLQTGQQSLEITSWNICWPHEFIRAVTLENSDDKFNILLDAIVAIHQMATFHSKEEAMIFQRTIQQQLSKY